MERLPVSRPYSQCCAAFIPSRWLLGFHFTDRERRCFWGSQQGLPRPCCSRLLYQIRCRCQACLRCGCHARLDGWIVLACQCLNQFVLVNQHVKGVVANCHTQYCLAHWSCLCGVKCFNCCVVDGQHCVTLCLVLYAPHYSLISSSVNPALHCFLKFVGIVITPYVAMGYVPDAAAGT